MPIFKFLNNQKGAIPLFLIVALIGVLVFIVLTSTFSFKENLFSSLYPKEESVAASEPLGIQPGQPIDDSGNILITETVADRLKSTGAGWVRINFRLGPYQSDTPEFYSKYDTIVNRLQARGLQVVALMSNESWPGGQNNWTENNFEHTGRDGHNLYIDQFGYAFGRLAKHYEGKIKYWEIWNEPNCYAQSPSQGVFTGCSFIYPSNFAAMLTHVHTQAHYYNNIDVQIIAGAVFGHDISGFGTGPAGADYLDETFNTGINKTGKFAWTKATYGTYPLDAIGQHIYITGNRAVDESAFSQYLDYIHNVLVKYEGPSSTKQTWVTEYGWATNQTDETTQANNLSKVVPIMRGKSYVANSFWFQLDESPGANLFYGLYRGDFSSKPAYTVFKNQNPTSSPTPTPTPTPPPAPTISPGQKADGSIVNTILNYYNTHGGKANWGSPYDNGGSAYAHMWDFGYVQDFNGGKTGKGAIFDSGHGVAHDFWKTYLLGNNHIILKFPTTEEYPFRNGTRQDFQGGSMFWDPVNKVRVFPK